jgi:outer membrane biosynthesis protein TonB
MYGHASANRESHVPRPVVHSARVVSRGMSAHSYHYLDDPNERRNTRIAALLTILFHVIPFAFAMYGGFELVQQSISVYDVQLTAVNGLDTEISEQPAPARAALPMPAVKPPEIPKPTLPEVKKEEPKPSKDEPDLASLKPKEEPKPKKPEPKKEVAKKELPKEEKKPPTVTPKKVAAADIEMPALDRPAPERIQDTKQGKENAKIKKGVADRPGIDIEALPSALGMWGRLVQRKVEKVWVVPGGVKLTEENALIISFWVDTQGNLVGEPVIRQDGDSPELLASGLLAIKEAAPYPPLPESFKGLEQEVQYTFVINP